METKEIIRNQMNRERIANVIEYLERPEQDRPIWWAIGELKRAVKDMEIEAMTKWKPSLISTKKRTR